MQFKDLDLTEIIGLIRSGETTQEEVFRFFLNRIESIDPKIEAFNWVNHGFMERPLESELA